MHVPVLGYVSDFDRRIYMYSGFAVMIGESFRESVQDFKKNGKSLSNGDESFRQGYLMGLYRVFTLIEQAAENNGISLEEIGISEIKDEDFLR
jgi:hypothetical protein